MKSRTTIIVAFLFTFTVLFSGNAVSTEKDVQFAKSMLESYQIVNRILMNLLVNENYQRVIRDTKKINRHAEALGKLKEGQTPMEHEMFVAYTRQLSGHVQSLQQLAQKIEESKKQGEIQPFLRTTATRHFGEIVTLCVACHENFKKN